MNRRLPCFIAIFIAAIIVVFGASRIPTARAQELDFELTATARVLPDVGPGLHAIRRDAAGRYYALTAPGASVMVFAPGGRFVGKIPASPTKETAISYGADLDVDAAGQIYVADRGANLIRVFGNIETGGQDVAEIPVNSPISVAALTGGEIAITSVHERHLVQILDLHGKLVREFGDLANLADHLALNRYLNGGRVITDRESHLYLAFTHYPEPTVRRYDRFGYSTLEIALNTLEFAPVATAKRRVIWEQDQKSAAADLKPVVNAIGVDPASGDIWIAVSDELVHYDRDGNRRGTTYRTFSPEGARVEPVSILVEPDRLLLAADPVGVFAFARPDKMSGNPEEKPAEKSESKPAQKPAAPSQKP